MSDKIVTTRVTEVLVEGYWVVVPFASIKQGDVFRLFEEDGEPVDLGQVSFAMTDAEPGDVWAVMCEPAGRKPRDVITSWR